MALVIREATTHDYPTFATLFRELGIYDPASTADHWRRRLVRDTLISEHAGRVEGYVSFIALTEAGHVRDLVVAPDARGRGVGRELMRAAADVLRNRGVGEWVLDVRVDNAPAIRISEDLGMKIEHRSTVLQVPIARIGELPAERAEVLPVELAEDEDIERALGLLAGRIAMMRLKDRTLVQLRDGTCAAVGFAALAPELPGAMPFRIARPTLARTLLGALARDVTAPRLQVVVEDDPATTSLLLEIGAEVRLELLHYRGQLPA